LASSGKYSPCYEPACDHIDRTLALLRQAISAGRDAYGSLLGLAVGVPGLVDQTTGVLLFAPNLGWRDVPLVVEAAHAGDAVTLQALDEVGHHLGIGIASLVNALNLELVVLGGILSLAGEFLLPAVNDELQRRALPWNQDATQVVLAQHGVDACVMSEVALVYQAILAQPGNIAIQVVVTY